MKKIILGALLSATVFLSACSQDNPVERFENALEKTGNLEQYKMSVEGSIDMSSSNNEEGRAQIGNMEFDILSHIDREETKAEISYKSRGTNVNMEVVGDSEQTIAKMPLTDKYVIMPRDTEGAIDLDKYKGNLQELSKEIYKEIGKTVREDGDISLDKAEIEFPNGSKEVDKGTVELESEEVKALLIRIAQKVYANEAVRDILEQQADENLTAEEREAAINGIRDNLDNIEIENFEYIVYIDEDDYIVGQDIKMNIMNIDKNRKDIPVDLESRIWDIGNSQNIELPEVNEENSITWEEYMERTNIEIPEELKDVDITEDTEVEDLEIPEVTTE